MTLPARVLALALVCAAGCGGDEAPAAGADPVAATPPRAPPLAAGLVPAARAIEARRFDEGRALAQAYLDAHPDDGQALFLLGLSSYWTANYGAARPWFERALAAQPQLLVLHDFLGHSLLMLGELEAARRHLTTYAAAVPGDPRIHYRLGLVELEETHLAAAAERFRHAIELYQGLDAPTRDARRAEEAECHARLGEVHFARQDYEAARQELERATVLCPENISAFYTLSLVLRRLGQETLAERASERYESARRALLETQEAPGR